jgi:hypothetical protein
MTRAAERRKIGLKLAHFRTHDELAVRKHLRNRIVDGFPKTLPLRSDVDKRNGSLIGAHVLVHETFPET